MYRLALFVLLTAPVFARHNDAICGTTRETSKEPLFAHRQILRARAARGLSALDAAPQSNQDIGNIAVIHDSGGVVERVNQFNLDQNTLLFTPVAAGYQYAVTAQGYDGAAASAGTPLAALGDDDTRLVSLPFAFPFFGASYRQVFVNSDGNLTFTAGDNASTQRSLGRMTAGPPRISPLFDDLDPSKAPGAVRVLSDNARVVVSWVAVPEYSDTGTGIPQTFQASLYADGRIEFSYSGVNPTGAVVGIAPGLLQGDATLTDFRGDASATYTAAMAEEFGNTLTIDIVTVAQQFYRTHDDAYDYLVIYNNLDIPALGEGTVAYESTVRSHGTGYGVPPQDGGQEYGSASRLSAVLNLGPLSQYPADPNGLVAARAPQHDTPLTILAHETGHLFLAFASVGSPAALPMLGFQLAHWSFLFDSEASVLEGERIVDQGAGVSPEFMTTDLAQEYAPLDQYLMGFRAAQNVPDTFYVTGDDPPYPAAQHPFSGVSFNGTRQSVRVGDVIAAEGPRTPDYTVAQRRFRFAFILVVAQGTQPAAADLAQIDSYRDRFEAFYAKASSNNASADTALRRSLKLSLFPAAGVLLGGTGTATVAVETPRATDLTVQLLVDAIVKAPPSITIPAGALSASFTFSGTAAGVAEVSAIPSDSQYETAFARVQVADAGSLELEVVPGGGRNPIVVRLTDPNMLPYPGARIVAAASGGGSVTPAAAVTDVHGQAVFHWTPGFAAASQLQIALDAAPEVSATVAARNRPRLH